MKVPVNLKVLLATILVTALVVTFAQRWPQPPPSSASQAPPAAQASRGSALSDDERNNVEIYNRVSPGVVNITTVVIDYDLFFRAVPQRGIGSGCILDREGHILTNYHVIEDGKIQVTLSDQSKYEAEPAGVDPINDIAIIRIKAPAEKLQPIKLASGQDIRVGQKVLAIGNPFGLDRTLTTGIVSSTGRTIQTDRGNLIDDVIQTDAAINKGNSGGPLLNAAGEMIGINTIIYSPSQEGGSIGIGFAVSARTLHRVVPDLLKQGRVIRPWLGVRGRTIFPQLAEVLSLPVTRGVLIEQVERGSSAERGGLRGGRRQVVLANTVLIIDGDIIVEVDGKQVETREDLELYLNNRRPGDSVRFKILRDGREQTLEIPMIAAPEQSRRLRS
ncbi:MAG: S1C family serine protease [Acidobacteriota bacterium]